MNSINIVSHFSFFLMILVFFFLVQQFDIGECFWEDSDVDGLRTNAKNQTFSLRGAPYDQNPSLTSTNNIDIDDDSYPKKYNAKVIIPKDKNIKPAVNLQNDETDDELSSHDDKGLEDRHPEDPKLNPISSTSTTIPSFPTYGQIKATKICVTLTPEYVSTRNGPLVSYECIAKICTGISPDQDDKVKGEYQFRRPLFDWNTGYSHLFVNNGTCDQDGLICRNKVDINVDSFLDTMEQSGLEQMEIRCVVADYIQSYDGFNYVTGEAMGVLKQFKGNRPHEPCNTTSDCGDNLICVRSTIREPFLSDSDDNNNSQDKESFAGYCECSTDDGSEIVVHSHPKQSYILMEDDQYQEQVCVPIRSLNQSCQYDQQCKQSDPNTYCRPLYTEDGIATTNLICDCMVGYYVATTTTTTQSTTIGTAIPNRCISGDSREDDSQDFDYDVSDGEEAKSDSSNKHEMVYIWWIFPPNSQQSHEILNKDLHGLPYYARRYLTIRNLSYILLVLTIVIPSVIIMISLAIYYYRKRSDSRQFQPRRTSFEDDSLGGVYFPGKPVSDICDEKPISFFEQIPSVQLNLCNLKQSQPQTFNDEDQRENISHDDQTKVNNLNKKNEDKLNLVLNDQLDIEFGTQNINHNDEEEEEEDQDERKFP